MRCSVFTGPLDLRVEGHKQASRPSSSSESDPEDYFDRRLPPTIPPYLTGELRVLAENIQGSIFCENPNVRWDAVAGLGEAKKLLKEAVLYPVQFPELFQGEHPSLGKRLPVSPWGSSLFKIP
jgi:SpoVK/Ycf46/Vps4 family AAA+-type ATPase